MAPEPLGTGQVPLHFAIWLYGGAQKGITWNTWRIEAYAGSFVVDAVLNFTWTCKDSSSTLKLLHIHTTAQFQLTVDLTVKMASELAIFCLKTVQIVCSETVDIEVQETPLSDEPCDALVLQWRGWLYHAKFARSTLNDANINTGEPQNWWALKLLTWDARRACPQDTLPPPRVSLPRQIWV